MGWSARALGAAALLIAGGVAQAEEAPMPPLGSNTELMQFYRMLPFVELDPVPHGTLGSNRPFKAIAFDVEATPTLGITADTLSDFAGAAMAARLADLGVTDDQIRILPRAWSANDRPPDGLTHCDILHVTLLVTSARMALDAAAMSAAAISLVAWQDAGPAECLARDRPVWVLRAAPRLMLARAGDIDSLRQQAHHQILALIDWELVEEVTRINAHADAAFNEMLRHAP